MIERPKVLPETPAPAGDLLSDLLGSMHLVGTVLADRFRRLLDQPPMHYLAGWRLQLAAQQLKASELPTKTIADRAGYESEAAFSRAFKRRFGLPPGEWRRQQHGSAPAGHASVSHAPAGRASASAGP